MKWLFSLLFILSSSISLAKEQINWLIIDFPPYYFNTDDKNLLGRDRSVIALLQQQLPNIDFTYQTIPGSRLIHDLTNPSNQFCFLSLYKTPERLQKIVFTQTSSTFGMAPTVMMLKEKAVKLNLMSHTHVSLKKLLIIDQLTLGLSPNRSFGNNLDVIINQAISAQIINRAGMDILENLVMMLHKERLDIVLGYPDEEMYLAQKHLINEDLRIFQLDEAPTYSRGYIGCTNTPKGAKHIALLDNALLNIYQTDDYQRVLTRWLPPLFHQQFNEFLLKATRTAPTKQ